MHEKTTVMVSLAGAESLYEPSRPVVVPIAVPATRTVTNSIGEFSMSETLPWICTCAIAAAGASRQRISGIMYVIRGFAFI